MRIDLHTHSNVSDGTDTPFELVKLAAASGLDVVALTDHDSIDGWSEAASALPKGMTLVPGAEISCQSEAGVSVHMLAYLFSPDDCPDLMQELADTRENRVGRMGRMLNRLNEAGYEVTMDEVVEVAGPGATLGRPHLADVLVAKGYFNHRNEVFVDLLHNNSKHYVAHYSPTPDRAIELIRAAGGVAVLAHPLASSRGATIDWQEFARLAKLGLAGVEVSHRDNDPIAARKLLELARDLDLIMTGSSDYHGRGKLNELGEFTTSPIHYERILQLAKNNPITAQ